MITVIGSINMDYTSQTQRLPQRGETLLAKAFHTSPGGKGANQAVAAARLGAQVHMIGALGHDIAGEHLFRRLKEDGILVTGVQFHPVDTGNALITVDEKGQNTIVVYPGANHALLPAQVASEEEILKQSEIVILQLEIPVETVLYSAKKAHENGVCCILNPAPAQMLPQEIYPYIDYITPNETELFVLTGEKDPSKGSQKLLDWGVSKVIVTLGEKGAFYRDGHQSFIQPGFLVQAKDTTAAGDTFNGALAVALLEKKSIQEALMFANGAGALSTLTVGAQNAIPTRAQVEAFLAK